MVTLVFVEKVFFMNKKFEMNLFSNNTQLQLNYFINGNNNK